MLFEIWILKEMLYIEKIVVEINFWYNILVMIICIKRNECFEMLLGLYVVLKENDVFYFVGDENCYE